MAHEDYLFDRKEREREDGTDRKGKKINERACNLFLILPSRKKRLKKFLVQLRFMIGTNERFAFKFYTLLPSLKLEKGFAKGY